ncbi:hypothetical protein LCGC14_1810370 [marine sediment metagenome]|uniref:Uncharacterized protein n=1 Tax=marine sediment metagenome TaxID=412755 RepID=A0A0F9J1R3_9ZZZZ
MSATNVCEAASVEGIITQGPHLRKAERPCAGPRLTGGVDVLRGSEMLNTAARNGR